MKPTTVSIVPTDYYDDKHNDEAARLNQEDLIKRVHMVSMVIYSLAFVLGVVGNGLVIFITGFRMKKTVNTIWFLNLAIADFAFTLFLPLSVSHLALKAHWPFGKAMCKINSTMAFLNLYASVYLLMVISIDRFISVLHPVWAQNHRTPRLASFVSLGVWILALVLCSPIFYFRTTAPHHRNITVCFMDYGEDLEQVRYTYRAMAISRFIFAFLIPFSIIVQCYLAIILRLRRNRLTRSSKPFKIITAVIVGFFVCWFPYHVFSFLDYKAIDRPDLRMTVIIGIPLTSSFAFVNSCLNPILYVFMGQDFKDRLKRSLFSTLENAFVEEGSHSTTNTRTKCSTELGSQDR